MSGYFPKLLHGWETWKRKSLSPAQNLVSGRIFPAFITPVRFQWHVSKNPHKSSGWWFQPLWKIWKSVGMIVPYILENKKCLKPPTSHHGSHSKIPQNPHKSIINPLPGRKNAQPPGVECSALAARRSWTISNSPAWQATSRRHCQKSRFYNDQLT